MKEIAVGIVIYNIAVLLLYGLDKLFAKLKARRVPEKILLTLTVLCGGFGGISGMVLFHHKVSKPAFRYTVSLIFILQSALLVWFCMTRGII